MRRRSRAAALALALAVGAGASGARAQALTGNDLLHSCQMAGDAGFGFCSGYMIGVIEGMRWGAFLAIRLAVESIDTAGANELSNVALNICDPGGTDYQQMQDIVVRYLVDNPGTRHESARALVQVALAAVFPCKAVQ